MPKSGNRHLTLFDYAASLHIRSDGNGAGVPIFDHKTDPCFPFFPAGIWRYSQTGSSFCLDLVRISCQRRRPEQAQIKDTISQETVNDGGDHDPDNAGDRKFDL